MGAAPGAWRLEKEGPWKGGGKGGPGRAKLTAVASFSSTLWSSDLDSLPSAWSVVSVQ